MYHAMYHGYVRTLEQRGSPDGHACVRARVGLGLDGCAHGSALDSLECAWMCLGCAGGQKEAPQIYRMWQQLSCLLWCLQLLDRALFPPRICPR